MNVEALDHVNIITDKLDATAEFYGKLLGLVRKFHDCITLGRTGGVPQDSSDQYQKYKVQDEKYAQQ